MVNPSVTNNVFMKPVTIYTTPTCGFCKMTKEFFKDNNVEYTEHDVSVDAQEAQKMVDLSGQMGVPVIVIGEGEDQAIIVGFDEPKLKETLGL